MKVTRVNYVPLQTNNNVIGLASVTLDDELVVTGIRLIAGKFNPFISFPSRKGKDDKQQDKYFDIVYPVTKELRKEIEEEVIKASGFAKKTSSKKEEEDFF